MKEMRFPMRQKVKDIVTGFTGHVTARVEADSSKDRYKIETLDGNGQPVEAWFEQDRLVETN